MSHITSLRVFIGYDSREQDAYNVCVTSLLKHSTVPLSIEPLNEPRLRHAGLYWRDWRNEEGQFVDTRDGKPFSTTFSFTRFLIPSLCRWNGIALYCDCDFLWRDDIGLLFGEFDQQFAAQVVKHDHVPNELTKMEGQVQTRYYRKNWSSLILYNCGHPSNYILTPHRVNNERGNWLHGFSWLGDHEIGSLESKWNWLSGISYDGINPSAVHFTKGTPTMPGHENDPYAAEWFKYLNIEC